MLKAVKKAERFAVPEGGSGTALERRNVPAFQNGTARNDFSQAYEKSPEKAERFLWRSGTTHNPFRSPRSLERGREWKTGTEE